MIKKNNFIRKNYDNNIDEELHIKFDNFYCGTEFIIIDIEGVGTEIGRSICDDLEGDGSYSDEDIYARVDNYTDEIYNVLCCEVEEYLRNNFYQ